MGAVGLAALARSAPAALFGALLVGSASPRPLLGLMRQVLAARAAALAVAAVGAALGFPLPVVLLLVGADGLIGALYWPAQNAITPLLATSTPELTRANVVIRSIESVSELASPAAAGVAAALAGSGAAFGLAAVLVLFGLLALSGVDSPSRAAEHGEVPGSALGGVRALRRHRTARVVLALYLLSVGMAGAVAVLLVPIATLGLGADDATVGYLGAATGVGSVLALPVIARLAGRRRLGRPMGRSFVGLGLGLGAAAALVEPVPVVAALALAGGCLAFLDVASLTLLQRLVRDRDLGAVFGVVESGWWAARGIGGVAAGLLVQVVGLRPALAVGAFVLVAVGAAATGRLWRVDEQTELPVRELAALRSVPFFAALAPLALERLALDLVTVRCAPGEVIIHRGEVGDRFYMVDDGAAVVRARRVRRLGPGRWFGEIALLHDVPRTATVRAATPTTLFALDRREFLNAVTTVRRP